MMQAVGAWNSGVTWVAWIHHQATRLNNEHASTKDTNSLHDIMVHDGACIVVFYRFYIGR